MTWRARARGPQSVLTPIHTARHIAAIIAAMDAMALQLAAGVGATPSSSLVLLRRLLDTHEPIARAKDSEGSTLIHLAVRAGNAELVAELINRNPELCAVRNFAGRTPTDIAREMHAGETITRLLKQAHCLSLSSSAVSLAASSTAEVVDEEACISLLPDEMQTLIMQMLDVKAVCSLRACSHRLRAVADGDAVWEPLCWTTFKVLRTNIYQQWRDVYIEHSLWQAGAKEQQEREREERYLDRRSAVGLARVCRQSVEAEATQLS